VELWEDDNPKYDELTDIINVGIEGPERLDPLEVYVCLQECSCPIGHNQWIQAPDWHPDISKLDLAAALVMAEPAPIA
jgi:hypothetical protein